MLKKAFQNQALRETREKLARARESNRGHKFRAQMDLGLGGPVEVDEESPNKRHHGPCNDSPYGCTKCFNAEDGTEGKCDWCKKNDMLRLTRAYDEPVLYAMCRKCRIKNEKMAEEEWQEQMEYEHGYGWEEYVDEEGNPIED